MNNQQSEPTSAPAPCSACPHCGVQIMDPFAGKKVIHNVKACGSKHRFHTWMIRKKLPSGSFTACKYKSTIGPVTAEHVRNSPSVRDWIGDDQLDSIYHPARVFDPQNAPVS